MAVGDQYFVVASATGRAGGSTPATTNDGRDPIGFTLSGATYDNTGNGEGEFHIASTGGFTSYVWVSGDQIYLNAGAGITAGLYTIASKVDADAILLTASAGSDSTSDVGSSDGPWGDASDETTGLQYAADNMSGVGTVCNICADANYVLTAQIDFDTNAFSAQSPGWFRGATSNGVCNGTTKAVMDGSGLSTGVDCWVANLSGINLFISDIRFTGDPAETTVSAAGNIGLYIPSTGSTRVARCQFDWFGATGLDVGGGGSAKLVSDCVAFENGGAGFLLGSTSANFLRCTSHDNGSHGFHALGNGTYIYSACLAYANGGSGIYLHSGTGVEWIVDGCVCDGNSSHGIQLVDDDSRASVINCSLTNNNGCGIGGSGGNGTIAWPLDANHFYNNTSGDVYWTPTASHPLDLLGMNTSGDPLYVSRTAGSEDFNTTASSPLRAAAIGY